MKQTDTSDFFNPCASAFISSAYFEVTFLPNAPPGSLCCFPLNQIYTLFHILSHNSIRGDPSEFTIGIPKAAIIFVSANDNGFCSRLNFFISCDLLIDLNYQLHFENFAFHPMNNEETSPEKHLCIGLLRVEKQINFCFQKFYRGIFSNRF